MCDWKKWIWPGILATVLLTALAMLMRSETIEQDLQAKALDDLSGKHEWAQVELDGRDLTLSGMAPTEEAASEALQIAEDAYDVRIASSNVTLPPIADPFVLSATKADNRLVLEGNVPDEATRMALAEAAKAAAPDAEVVDNMTLARGAPAGFAALSGFAVSQLTDFTSGKSSLSGSDLTVEGVAPSVDIYNAANAALAGALPGDGKLAGSNISGPTADPYTLAATKTADGITLEGFVPSNEAKASIVAAAETAAEGGRVTDNLELALGAPDGFADTAAFGVSQLAGMTGGSASLDGMALSVRGDARTVESYEAIENALKNSLPQGTELALDDVTSPSIAPYIFNATEAENGIVLSGFVPDEATRAALVEQAATVTDGQVTDNLEIGPGAPSGFADLAGFAVGRLGDFSVGSASLSNRDLTVEGTALSPDAYVEANSVLAGAIPADGNLVSSNIIPATVSPYTFSATRDGGVLVLEGYVPSSGDISAATDFAKSTNPQDRIVNRLKVAGGVPQGLNWTDASQYAIREASRLQKGRADLSNGDYSIEGAAGNNRDFNDLNADASRTLPQGLNLAKADVTRPVITPYVWSFTNMEDGVPTLSGYVPEEALAAENTSQIEARLGTGKAVSSGLEVGAGAPRNLNAATSVAIQATSRLINGKAEITGTDLMVTGEALSELAASQIRASVENGLPPGFVGKHNITVRQVAEVAPVEADECQTLLTDNLRNNSIRFETDKSVIKEDSFGLLDRLSFVVKRCPTTRVEIAGHTDSDGSDEYNQTLSEDRANAVRSYLVDQGVFVGRLQATGYGETQPIADNGTEEGKAQNRRIEFTVIN